MKLVKKLMESIREYKKASILTPIFVTVEVVMEVLIPFVMASLIDKGIEAGSMSVIWKYGILLLVLAMISLAFGTLAGHQASIASCGLSQNLRKDMYYRIQNFSFSNIDKFSTASIVTRLTTDVTNVQNAYQMLIRVAVRAPIMIIFAMVMSFSINVKISLIFLATIPVLGFILIWLAQYVHPYFERVFNTYDRLNEVVQENLHGVRVVKSFIREEYEDEKFGKISQKIYKDFAKAEKLLAFNSPAMMSAINVCLLAVAWIGAKAIIVSGNVKGVAGGLTTGELMSLFTYALQILMCLMMISMVFVMIIIARSSAERIVEILTEESDIQNKKNPVTEVADGSIEFENVEFYYAKKADKPVLDNINLKINSGETIGIIGGTGSAKSSLVQLIPRLYDVTGGDVKVGGVDVRDYDLETLRDSVAMVLQKNVLFSGTIKENLRWGNEKATDEELIHACELAQADDFVQTFPHKYDTYIEQGGNNVSGGQKQRLCIARALLKKPKILILDDSTSAVDTATEAKIRESLYHDLKDTTKIIIAQRISSVQEADQILVLEDGKIIGHGTHEELLKTCEAYSEIYTTQIGNQSIRAGEEAAV